MEMCDLKQRGIHTYPAHRRSCPVGTVVNELYRSNAKCSQNFFAKKPKDGHIFAAVCVTAHGGQDMPKDWVLHTRKTTSDATPYA
mmetsp:Transcript_119182/g.207447  ORF Transcript_119182/g.207447 Transcript_119182/m.207447 type:complete len:85 (+) Transcript_119182:567-821(+)